MKQIIIALSTLSLIAMAACSDGDSESTPPSIHVDVNVMNLAVRTTNPDLEPLHFDLQIYNRGDEVLVIENVRDHGDDNDAFTISGPDITELQKNESAFIRGWYSPSVVGDDTINLEIRSNDPCRTLLTVPVCGRAVAPGTTDVIEPPSCEAPADPSDC